MKKIKIYALGTVMLGALMMSSCGKDFLDRQPYNARPADQALNTEKDIESALIGAYAGLRDADLFGRTLPLLGDLMADNVVVSNRNSGRYIGQYQYNFTNNDSYFSNLWQDGYIVINRVNNIINAKVSGGLSDQYKGEAYAIRALVYFELVNFFARPYTDNPDADGVPLVLKFDINGKPARSSVAEIYKQILSDLDQASKLTTRGTNTGRFSPMAVRALQAKVNLFMGTNQSYQEALSLSADVIKNSGISLLSASNLQAYWAKSSSERLGVETLFEIVSDRVDNNGFNELSYIYSQEGYGDMLVNENFYKEYRDNDVRKSLIAIGVRQGTGGENPAYIATKNADVVSFGAKKVLRLSECYLNAAEAAFHLGDETTARSYLQTLVDQREPGLMISANGAALLESIISERRKELAFEGDRLFTLNRLRRDITARTSLNAANLEYNNLAYSDFRRVAPIPLVETDRNNNLKQNPGW